MIGRSSVADVLQEPQARVADSDGLFGIVSEDILDFSSFFKSLKESFRLFSMLFELSEQRRNPCRRSFDLGTSRQPFFLSLAAAHSGPAPCLKQEKQP